MATETTAGTTNVTFLLPEVGLSHDDGAKHGEDIDLHGSLNTGGIVGVTLSCIVILVIILIVALVVWKRNQKLHSFPSSDLRIFETSKEANSNPGFTGDDDAGVNHKNGGNNNIDSEKASGGTAEDTASDDTDFSVSAVRAQFDPGSTTLLASSSEVGINNEKDPNSKPASFNKDHKETPV